jgi:hypothetical protein
MRSARLSRPHVSPLKGHTKKAMVNRHLGSDVSLLEDVGKKLGGAVRLRKPANAEGKASEIRCLASMRPLKGNFKMMFIDVHRSCLCGIPYQIDEAYSSRSMLCSEQRWVKNDQIVIDKDGMT